MKTEENGSELGSAEPIGCNGILIGLEPFSSVSPAGTADHDGGALLGPVWNPKFDTLLGFRR